MTPRLSIRNLTVDFDMGRDVVRALHGVDIDVMPGARSASSGRAAAASR
jgi:ABC-type dipeptide/oligopeptide/nickel transport system ATPase component